MIRWGRGRSQGRGCCIVIPIGCLFSVMLNLVFSGLAVAQLLQRSIENLYEHRAKQEALAQKMNANWDRFLDLTSQKRTLFGPEYERAGRMEGDMQERTAQREDGREGALKLFFGRICCLVGLLLSAGGFVVATLGASANLSAGAVGIGLGVLGYFLGARRLGAASVVLGTAAVFFMAAASTGLIPGVGPLGHGYDQFTWYVSEASYAHPSVWKDDAYIAGRSTTVYRKDISLCLTFAGSG